MSEIPPNKSFQPWNIDVVDASLQYARNIATRKVALTISLAYSTIEEWYYLVRESNKSFKQQKLDEKTLKFHLHEDQLATYQEVEDEVASLQK
ncbi:unnamed protein product [Pocillopora meandrina]|uniref:Uncharacterized protein n=1 Tax=Pocillopora meandrina TaxID=46732 RepID=A0AAU9VTH7_9CNID|nr:unnamed protein product [Pocillopora meandrina]